MEAYLEKLLAWSADRLRDLLIALIFIWIGLKVARLIVKGIAKTMERSKLEPGVVHFLLSLLRWLFYFIVFISGASILGFEVTSLVTLLGTGGLAVGFGLQGSLANLAGGILIMILKPFQVGDYILETDKNCEGTVTNIDIFYTKLRTIEKKQIVIPNGNIMNHAIVNLTAEGVRRLNIKVGVPYDSDLKKVRDALQQVISDSAYMQDTDQAQIFVDSFDESAIIMGLRCDVKAEQYFPALWDTNERIISTFSSYGITIPYKQVDLHFKEGGNNL